MSNLKHDFYLILEFRTLTHVTFRRSHPYHLDEFNLILRRIRINFSFHFFYQIPVIKQNIQEFTRKQAFCNISSGAIRFAYVPQKECQAYMRRVVRKPAFCIC